MKSRRARLDPSTFGLRLSALNRLYRAHWRSHRAAQLMAGAGIAIGVALVFGVLVANSSILGSTGEAIHAVDGSASLELVARSSQGFSERVARRVSETPGVAVAAPLLRESAVIEGPKGRVLGQLVGVSARIVGLESSATSDLGAGAQLLSGGIGLPSGVADTIGARTERHVNVSINGVSHSAQVRAVLNSGAIGSLAASRIAVTLLRKAQILADQPGRVTEVLVKTDVGKSKQVERDLRRLAHGQINVEPADHELELAKTALKPTNQSTSLFAAISMMVGFLLALNAMLLTVPERRWQLAEMLEQGYDSRQISVVLVSQALALGIAASIAGVAIGDVLAHTIFNGVPSYLATTFPITGHQQVHLTTALFAFACGLLASVFASMLPLIDLRKNRPLDTVLREPGEPGQNISDDIVRNTALAGLTILILATFMVLFNSELTVLSGVVLGFAALCFIPILLGATTRVLRHITRRYHGGILAIATIELEATATRSVALACITALAIYGSTAVGGARADLIRGLDQGISQQWRTAAIWITPNENIHDTDSLHVPGIVNTILHTPGVTSISARQGTFLDLGAQRLWIRAAPSGSASMILSSQLLQGNITRASKLMRQGGWATVSSGFASEHHLSIGGPFTLPSPSGLTARFHVAAVTTNIGWPPGTITLNTSDYSHYWQSTDPTTLAVDLTRDVTPREGVNSIRRVLGPMTRGLRVQSSNERITEVERIARQGLSVLSDISHLLLAISALALAAAISTAITQRRGRLASLKAQGYDSFQLWRSILLESAVVLGVGCLDGAILGLYGHALADRYLRLSTAFPAPFSVGPVDIAFALVIVIGASLAVIAIPGFLAAGVAAELSFSRE